LLGLRVHQNDRKYQQVESRSSSRPSDP